MYAISSARLLCHHISLAPTTTPFRLLSLSPNSTTETRVDAQEGKEMSSFPQHKSAGCQNRQTRRKEAAAESK